MWKTSAGTRILEGAEAKLFATALITFAEDLKICEGEYYVGVNLFDDLTYGQKIFLLHKIGKCLLREDIPAPKLNASVESAVAAVYEHLRLEVSVEIDEPELDKGYRPMILAARKENGKHHGL